MSKPIRRRDKWHFLRLGASWGRSVVPIYEAAARGKCVPLLMTLLTSARIDLNTASYNKIVQIPHIGPVTARRIMRARENMQIRYSADLEKIIRANICRRVSQYI